MKIITKEKKILDFSEGCQILTDGPTTGLVFWSDGYHPYWDDIETFYLLPSWREIFGLITNKLLS